MSRAVHLPLLYVFVACIPGAPHTYIHTYIVRTFVLYVDTSRLHYRSVHFDTEDGGSRFLRKVETQAT
jgi:hypothetical protein